MHAIHKDLPAAAASGYFVIGRGISAHLLARDHHIVFELAAMGEVEALAVSTAELDCMDMEAAEQLLQLSGSDDGGDESESKSADSVSKAVAGERKDKEAAVESSAARRQERFCAEKAKEEEEAVIGGHARRRPRFRSLRAVYRETRRLDGGRCRESTGEAERKKTTEKKKTARDGAGRASDEVMPTAEGKKRRVVQA